MLQRCGRVNDPRKTQFTTSFTFPFTLSLEQVKEKKGNCVREATEFGRRTGRYVGWSDPIFCARGVPNSCVESLQPTRLRAGHNFGIKHEVHESASRTHLQFGGR